MLEVKEAKGRYMIRLGVVDHAYNPSYLGGRHVLYSFL
jgi:hypothetical protein